MNYDVVPLNGGNQFDLNGVRFNGKSFLFWKKKSNQNITEVSVIFDKKYENIPVRDGMAVLSLKGLSAYNDLKEAIEIFRKIIKNDTIRFRFIVENENERMIADSLGKELGIYYVIENVNSTVRQNMDQNVKKMEEEIKRQSQADLVAGGNQMIEKNDNGVLKQITVHDGIAYENNGPLNTEEEKMSLLKEWMQDPRKAEELMNLSEEARNDLLTQAVISNRKGYRMESAREQVANDKMGEVARDKAIQEDGLVNTELGITQNNVSNSNQYSAVEQQGENVQVVNPNVVNASIRSSGMSNNGGTSEKVVDFADYRNNSQMEMTQEQQREVNSVFYMDEEFNLYNNDGIQIGRVGMNGYQIDFENNMLMKDGQTIGSIGDYKDMGRSNSNIYAKPKVHTLKKQEKNAAFVSLPVIIFILSALLLIVSAVLLFIVE